jgi:transcriptional regulator with XRE-family HTH domain
MVLLNTIWCGYARGMNSLLRIRTEVFRVSQAAMADIAGVDQCTWSRWERGLRDPSLVQLKAIRDEARRRRLRWNDSWFFEPAAVAA